MEEKSFAELLAEHGDPKELAANTIVEGIVTDILSDGVVVDVGYKTEGHLGKDEFRDEELENLKKGDKIKVYIVKLEDKNGNLILSKKKADEKELWDKMYSARKNNIPVKAKIVDAIDKGYIALIDGVLEAFIPFSLIDIIKKDQNYYLGKEFEFYVNDFNKKRKSVVLNRRKYLEEKRKARLKEFQEMEKGTVINGKVTRTKDFGVFVDVGDVEGLIHVSDLSWGRLRSADGFFREGEEIKVVFLGVDNGKIKLGYKQLTPNPWEVVMEKYSLGEIIEAKVKNVISKGAFVELEPGLEGYISPADITWSRKNKVKIEDWFKGKEKVKVRIMSINPAEKRIRLSCKHLSPDPWLSVKDKYKEGDKVVGYVTNIQPYGAFVEIEDGIEGMIHVGELSWSTRIRDPRQVVKVGDKVEAQIIGLDLDNRKISLSMKAILPNPWEEAAEKFPPGTILEGTVKNVENYGAFVEIMPGIEGLLHVSDFYWDRKVTDARKELKPGQKIKVKILDIDEDGQKLKLGMKQVEPDPWFDIENRFKVGEVYEAEVSQFVKGGMMVKLDKQIEAFVHSGDISWEKRVVKITEEYNLGDKIKVKILFSDSINRKIKAGVKQLTEDPWAAFARKNPVDTIVEGIVEKLLNNGVILKIEEKVSGFIPRSHLGGLKIKTATEEGLKEGDKVEAAIIELNPDKRILKLSVQKANELREREELDRFKQEVSAKENVTLGDIYGNIFNEILGAEQQEKGEKEVEGEK